MVLSIEEKSRKGGSQVISLTSQGLPRLFCFSADAKTRTQNRENMKGPVTFNQLT